jgi:ribokinase
MNVAEPIEPPTVIVVGSVNVDLNLRLPKLPATGETVVGGKMSKSVGGKGANQSVAAARLGAITYLVGRIGADADGHEARQHLHAAGVRTDFLLDTYEAATGVAAVLTDRSGENLIGVASGANASVTAEDVTRAISAITTIASTSAVVLACLEIPLDAVAAAARGAEDCGCLLILNPAPAQHLPLDLLSLVSVLTPNEHELTGLGFPDAQAMLTAGVGVVAVTKGAAGVDVYTDPNGGPRSVPAFNVDAVDTTGAGDAFSGCLAWALGSRFSVLEAIQLATTAGALATQGVGAQTSLPTSPELLTLCSLAVPDSADHWPFVESSGQEKRP